MKLLEVTHHSGKKTYINPQHIVTVDRSESGDTILLLVAGPPLAVKDSEEIVLAHLGHQSEQQQLEYMQPEEENEGKQEEGQ